MAPQTSPNKVTEQLGHGPTAFLVLHIGRRNRTAFKPSELHPTTYNNLTLGYFF